MARRIRRVRSIGSSRLSLGGLVTQASPPSTSRSQERSASSQELNLRRNTRRSSRTRSVTAVSTTRNRSTRTINSSVPALTKATVDIPLTRTVGTVRESLDIRLPIERIRLQLPSLVKPPEEKFSEDVLNVSETRLRNNRFEIVEKDGISPFIPEILQMTDFLPIWDRNTNRKRFFQDFSAAGRLIDIQYNSLLLRRETLNDLISNLTKSRRENVRRPFAARNRTVEAQEVTNRQIDNFERKINEELERTKRTLRYYRQFISASDILKTLIELKTIPGSRFDRQFLTLDKFFERRMQYNNEQFGVFSDSKILMQLLADFKEIAENYSINLLGLTDTDRRNDNSPVLLDRTYTLNDGFTFNLEQIRSETTPINASERAFFNGFLNSLPNNPDGRIKLLITILSKEYRVSRGLGIPNIQKQLQDVFASGDTGSPFDNIIGIAGDNIFETPLGPESLLSLTTFSIDENTSVLPFERKYVDAEQTKKTFVPGSSFFFDSLLEVRNDNFNTAPFEEYSNQFSKKFNSARDITTTLFDLARDSVISPSNMNDEILSSFKNSIENLTNISQINRDQAVIAALFKLANTDNKLKSKLFQFCLLAGLASNSPEDNKPIFRQLASEIGNINQFSEVKVTEGTSPNLFAGLRTLRPFIERLAADIENRVLALTTPTPRFSLEVTLRANPQFTRLRNRSSQRTSALTAYSRLNISALRANQDTINIDRLTIRRILMGNVDSKSSSISNFIKEFIGLANNFTQAAAFNGEQKYLLNDQTGRTRYNFISTSTQLLILFEIISSYVAKYSFASFSRSPSVFNALVTVDAEKNDFVEGIIEDIIGEKSVSVFPFGSLSTRLERKVPDSDYSKKSDTTSGTVKPVTAIRTSFQPQKITIKRSGDSSKSSSDTMLFGGMLSKASDSAERSLIEGKLSGGFFGTGLLKRLGLSRLSPLLFRKLSVNLKNSMFSIRAKVSQEDAIISNILNIFQVLEERIKEAKTRMLSTFNSRNLQAFLEENTLEDLEIVKNPTQVRAAAFAQMDFYKRTTNVGRIGRELYTWFMDTETIQPESRVALYSLLSQNQYLKQNQADRRIKILSVGIPAGFSKHLSDRVQQSAIKPSTFKSKQIDVVSVNVYKRDQRYDDIVFKPQSFFFDLSLFQDEDRIALIKPRQNENYQRLLNRAAVFDFENIEVPRAVTSRDIVENDKYSFLTNEQKRSIIENHTTSSLLELYMRLLTGMRIDEKSFITREIPVGSSLDEQFKDIIFQYIRGVLNVDLPNQPINELLENPNIDDEAKDILRLFVFGDIIFEPEKLRNQIASPRAFDRIFHLPLNIEEFEIDEDLTRETESGKMAFEQTFIQERLVRRGEQLFFRPRDKNELLFEDYFVTIENVI